MMRKKRESFKDKVFYLIEPAYIRASSLKIFTMIIVEPDPEDLVLQLNGVNVFKGLSPEDYINGNTGSPTGVNICTLHSSEVTTPKTVRDEDLRFCVASNIDLAELAELGEDPEFKNLSVLITRYQPMQYSLRELHEYYSDKR